jgi:hypothetical protein
LPQFVQLMMTHPYEGESNPRYRRLLSRRVLCDKWGSRHFASPIIAALTSVDD